MSLNAKAILKYICCILFRWLYYNDQLLFCICPTDLEMVDHSAQEAAQKAGFYAIHIRYEPLTKVTTNFVQSLTYISKEYDQN